MKGLSKSNITTKSAKLSAYEALIKYNISALPVPINYDPKEIKIFTIQFLARYHNESCREYFKLFGHRGFVIYESVYDRYIIFINETDPEALQRWSISIAIGYIESHRISHKYGNSINESDKYITDFTYTYTCPDCVLKRDKILSSEEIAEVCAIPLHKAKEKSKRLKIFSDLNDSKILHIEKILCNIFREYVLRRNNS